MKLKDIQNVVELLKIAKLGTGETKEEEKKDLKDLKAVKFNLPKNLGNINPIISVDGSYSFLFSFLGAETWIVLFRIAVTEFNINLKGGKIYYNMGSGPKVYDHLNLLSYNENVLASQPKAFSIAANINKSYSEINPQLFASNIMTYLEDITLEKISETRKNCMLLKDGALLTFKALERVPIYTHILDNCVKNKIALVGISKSNSTHIFENSLTDDYFLKRYYDKKYSDLTYIPIPRKWLKYQTRFDAWGDIHFAKLHRNAKKWFRIDVGHDVGNKNELFSILAAYSMVQLIPGYPIGLIETHKIAKSVRDLKGSYELELITSLKEIGLNAGDILDGAVDIDGRQFGSFHEILDQFSK
jgi:hypothetical protein